MGDALVYVYAITGMTGIGELPAVEGVAGAPVRAITAGELAAVVSSVDTAEFGEEALRRNLEDLSWLERTARAHHAVVDAVARPGPAAPLRLATVYLSDDNVRSMLDEQQVRFTTALDRVRGRAEWGVKAFGRPQPVDPVGEEPTGPAAGPGTTYLMRRRTERDRAARSLAQAHEQAERLHTSLARLAVTSRAYPPQDPRLSGERDEMVLNAAYLVEETRGPAVRELVDTWDAPGLRLELTGPWAPYSFASPDDS
ncbi:GvpL/GvpF family gas vesicle protein [Pseudonocardia bannensis]|uniref:GvpL/GvpF family gas vesicle protein n=1 Tax=Pseudonocardia bannensis TaxID=630973 RepID=A0A848DRV5_9PSEU|nr:GvpL/GvpF family gas vesicle protein [Pseudonocardia bannensis]